MAKATHGMDEMEVPGGMTVGRVQDAFGQTLNIPQGAEALVNGTPVPQHHVVRDGDRLEFYKPSGRKGVGEYVWTEEEFLDFFKITTDDLRHWISQGLKVGRRLDGSLRITATAVDEFLRGRVIESPYFTVEEAAVYCRTTEKGIYSMIEAGKLKKCQGSRRCLFTKAMLDAAMNGEE